MDIPPWRQVISHFSFSTSHFRSLNCISVSTKNLWAPVDSYMCCCVAVWPEFMLADLQQRPPLTRPLTYVSLRQTQHTTTLITFLPTGYQSYYWWYSSRDATHPPHSTPLLAPSSLKPMLQNAAPRAARALALAATLRVSAVSAHAVRAGCASGWPGPAAAARAWWADAVSYLWDWRSRCVSSPNPLTSRLLEYGWCN